MTECEKYREAISAYVDNELNNAEQEELMQHIAQCEDCARLLNEYREVSALFQADVEVPEGLTSGVMAEIAKINRAKRITFLTRRVLPVAACLVLAVGAVRFLPRMGSGAPVYKNSAMDMAPAESAPAPESAMDGGGYANYSDGDMRDEVEFFTADCSETADIPVDDSYDNKLVAEPEESNGCETIPAADDIEGMFSAEINIYLEGQDASALPDLLQGIEFEVLDNGVSRANLDSTLAEKLIDALSYTELAYDVADIRGEGDTVTVNVYR